MRIGQIGTWLWRGTYPRLYVPVLLAIVLVSAVRYGYLMTTASEEVQRHGAAELRRVGEALLPTLAALPVEDAEAVRAALRAGADRFAPRVQALQWQWSAQPLIEVHGEAVPTSAPAWFTRWLGLAPPVQQFGQASAQGQLGRLTVVLQPQPMVDHIWSTVAVQMFISALNIAIIFAVLTLLLRANARMLQRLTQATDAFRQGRLDTRMEVTGTLESRAMASAFNDMATKVQSLVLSLRETQRLQSEQLHFTRQLIDALPLPVFVRDPKGIYLEVNRAWQRLFQPPKDAARSPLPAPYHPPELTPERSARIAQAQNNEVRIQPANRFPARDMAYYEATFTSSSGAPAGTIGTLVDVTDRKRAEEALRVEKERAEVTLASIGDGVITTGGSGCIESINGAAQLMTGFTAEQAIGRQLEDVFRLYEERASRIASTAVDHGTIPGSLQSPAQDVLIHRSGERYAIEYTATSIRMADGMAIGRVLVFRDVTETRNLRHQISWHARHDALTGLYNRAALAERLTHAVFAARQRGQLLAVCMLDLDRFQAVNDSHGNRVGDRLLKETALRLNAFAASAPGGAVARMGGDEFVLLLGEQADLASIEARLQALMQQLAAPYAIDDRMLRTTASIGVAVFPHDDASPDTLLRHADQAMCQAKSEGRNRIHVFDVQRDHAVQTLHNRQTRVAQALRAGELLLHYQPKVNLRTGEILGLEALLRWQHPDEGLLGPHQVLPLIENADLAVELGEWVLREALAQMRLWTAAGMAWEVSVNITPQHFQRSNFVDRLADLLHACPEVAARRLELEILETAALEDMQHMREMMRGCQALGVRFALDDFGTGYSSLSYLKRLPAESIKIDQSFVRGILDDADDLTLVSAIVALASALQRHVVAEGVETPAHAARLLELGCERGQGFGIARPMPAHEVLDWARDYETQRLRRAEPPLAPSRAAEQAP